MDISRSFKLMALPCMKLNDSDDDYSGGEGQDNLGFADDDTEDEDVDEPGGCKVHFGPSIIFK